MEMGLILISESHKLIVKEYSSTMTTDLNISLFICHLTGSMMGNVVQRMNVSLGERGDRLTRAEDKTVELMHKTHQFAETAHKVARQ